MFTIHFGGKIPLFLVQHPNEVGYFCDDRSVGQCVGLLLFLGGTRSLRSTPPSANASDFAATAWGTQCHVVESVSRNRISSPLLLSCCKWPAVFSASFLQQKACLCVTEGRKIDQILSNHHAISISGVTWRIIPVRFSGSLAHGDLFRPKDRVTWDPFQMAQLHG